MELEKLEKKLERLTAEGKGESSTAKDLQRDVARKHKLFDVAHRAWLTEVRLGWVVHRWTKRAVG